MSEPTEGTSKRRGRPLRPLVLSATERRTLRRWAAGGASSERLALRSRLLLSCAAGLSNAEVAVRLELTAHTVGRWRGRFLSQRLGALRRTASPGAPPRLGRRARDEVARLLRAARPGTSDGATRRLARRCGMSQSSASRIKRELTLLPWALDGSAAAPEIDLQRVVDIVGLHLNLSLRAFALLARPPVAPVVSIAQANESAPSRPLLQERLDSVEAAARRAAALTHRRRSTMKLRAFLKALARAVPEGHQIHVLATSPDPIGPAVRRWLGKNPHVRLHQAATRAAWRDLLDGWCAAVGGRPERSGPLAPLAQALDAHLAEPAREPRPLTWILPS